MTENNEHWYALYTKPRWEKKVAKLLDEQGIENTVLLIKLPGSGATVKKLYWSPFLKDMFL